MDGVFDGFGEVFVIHGPTPDELVEDGQLVSAQGAQAHFDAVPGKFPLGKVYFTPGITDPESGVSPWDIAAALVAHKNGDWGDVCDEDKQANERDLRHGGRLLSVYYSRAGTKFWVLTESDRSATTVMLPSEY
ncbi:hypothetical protein D3C72_772780 [compost metagenome]